MICWFRHDLRLLDNPALLAAQQRGGPVVTLYILDETERPLGGASRWWLHHSLDALQQALAGYNGRLLLRRGDPVRIISELCDELGSTEVCCTRHYSPAGCEQETRLRQQLPGFRAIPGYLLFEPESLYRKGKQAPYKVFTPFWRTCQSLPAPHTAGVDPATVRFDPAPGLASEALADWQLLPRRPDWSAGLRRHWQPGEQAARSKLHGFIQERLADYPALRDRPDRAATSELSPHLHFGELSPARVWQQVHTAAASEPQLHGPGTALLRQLAWRDFCWHLLFHWPHMSQAPLREHFSAFPWHDDPPMLKAWQQGMTGYPLVDAGMRQLWECGWMHNRVRMVCASVLVKNLMIPWQRGEAWFWDTLVDADMGNNAGGWQWVAGCGADASPYFRIFNPTLQARRFDPDGHYIRHWVPELKDLPAAYVHAPWEAPNASSSSGPGHDYPAPVFDHASTRAAALAHYQRFVAGR